MSSLGLLALAPVVAAAVYILVRYGRVVGLVLWGFVKNKLDRTSVLLAVSAEPEVRRRLSGKTCLVTGANRGLGRGIAVQLAAFGTRVLVACRNGLEDAPREILSEAAELIREAGPAAPGLSLGTVEAVQLDVSNSKSVERLVADLKRKGVSLDFFVTNAAVVPLRSEVNSEGLEAAFATNYFGHWLLTNRLIEERVLALPEAEEDPNKLPRVVVVASESHRISKQLSKVDLMHIDPFSVSTAMNYYAFTKMLLISFAFELARRINQSSYFGGARGPRAVVRVLCPGPVDSNIAHHAPQWVQTLLKPMFKLLFAQPIAAARSVVGRLSETLPAGSEPLNAMYYHMLTPKAPRSDALDPTEAARLWGQSEAIRSQLQNQ